MAVYAAYRHVELDNIGYGKKRVLKPPGGGSSDIFGAPDPAERSPRRVRNHLQSSVLAGGTDTTVNGLETPSRGKPGNDSYDRLFGSGSVRPASTTKNRLKSNIPLGAEDLRNGNENICPKAYTRRNPITGAGVIDRDSFRRSAKKRDGNTGGEKITNGEKAPQGLNNGDSLSSNSSTGSASSMSQQRARVPPGGFSSGLW